MLLFGRRAPGDPRVNPRHRRRARRRGRHGAWLRLALFWRKNRKVAQGAAGEPTLHTGPEDRSGKAAGLASGTWPILGRLLCALGLTACLLGLGAGAFYFVRHSERFSIREVRFTPTARVSTDSLRDRAQIRLGENLFRLDLRQVRQRLMAEPWLKEVRVRRELPAAIAIDIVEYRPEVLVALGALYLADEDGVVFKRATPAEAGAMPVVTGIERETYLGERGEAQGLLQAAIAALSVYRAGKGRPPIGEVHVDRFAGMTLYTLSGTAIRIGSGDPAELKPRLRRMDAVLAALRESGQQARLIFLNNRAHLDQVTVRLEE